MDPMDLKQITRAVVEALEEQGMLGSIEMGHRWAGGTLVMEPGDTSTQGKEIPLETFFKKIVSVRNQLRVLEQKINGLDQLDNHEKVELQQYITKAYGTLTTFNVLFQDRKDYFVGAGSSRRR
jgi:hypothetical protein